MLVLTRKLREAVVVGGGRCRETLCKVTVLEIKHGRVRLGFEATSDVPVQRWELWKRSEEDGLSGGLNTPVVR